MHYPGDMIWCSLDANGNPEEEGAYSILCMYTDFIFELLKYKRYYFLYTIYIKISSSSMPLFSLTYLLIIIFNVLLFEVPWALFNLLTIPMPKGRGFLLSAKIIG